MTFHFSLDHALNNDDPLAIRLVGRMTLGPHLLEFSRTVTSAVAARGTAGVLLDMSEIEAIDSAGLGELVILYTAAGRNHCRLCLVRPSAHIIRLLETTRLRAILPDFGDTESAKAWLSRV